MKRSTFFATFLGALGIARAQQWKDPIRVPQYDSSGKRIAIDIQKDGIALNNQCPVCGTMAEPYHRRTEYEEFGGGVSLVDQSGTLVQPSKTKLTGPGRRQVPGGCKRCNASFWQSAED